MTEKPMGRPRKDPVTIIEYNGERKESIEVIVMAQSTTGRIYTPKDWIGHKVLCILVD